jgi:hypothetical protein
MLVVLDQQSSRSVGNTLLFGINHMERERERERMMEEKRNAVAIPLVLTDEVEDREVR